MKKRYLKRRKKSFSLYLPNGACATFVGKPTKETIEALNNMVQLAMKNLK